MVLCSIHIKGVHRCRIHSALDNISDHFSQHGKKPSIHELRTFRCDVYPITSFPKKLDEITQEGSFMGYTNRTPTKNGGNHKQRDSNTVHMKI